MSATISPDAVAKLRSQTGAGMMDCKRALATAGGDMDKALQILREQGAASAAKKAGRSTGDGLVTAYVEGNTAVLLELNCETDFVARTDDFKKLIGDYAQQAAKASPAWKTPADAPQKPLQDAVAKLGENMSLRRFERYDLSGAGAFGVYIHPSGGTGKVGVLVELSGDASSEAAKTLAKDLAMQIAATSPRWLSKEEVPADVLESEKKIARELAKNEGKPEKIWDKIAEGKLTQFYGQFCLLEQNFVKDPAGKTKVSAVVAEAAKAAGAALAPKRFVRYKVAEEA
jgi:elongation factor Ts